MNARPIRLLLTGLALLVSAASLRGQTVAPVPGGGDLLDWLGLAPGDSLLYQRESGERFCVEVGPGRALGGRRWATLRGLPWPGLASDSQILVPLDGALDLGVIRTPGPRPRADALLEAGTPIRPYDIPAGADPLRSLSDGWYAFGDPADPDALLYVWCAACMDAGVRIRLEKGRGIVSVQTVTIAGAESLTLIEGSCDPERGSPQKPRPPCG